MGARRNHQKKPFLTRFADHPMASAFALGGFFSLVWVGVAAVFAWNALSGGVAGLIFGLL
jgi:hypothetical protein